MAMSDIIPIFIDREVKVEVESASSNRYIAPRYTQASDGNFVTMINIPVELDDKWRKPLQPINFEPFIVKKSLVQRLKEFFK